MYAVVRLNSFDPSKLSASSDTLEQFDRIHAAQPGYVGTVVVDLQAGRRLVVNLWESEGHAAEALSVLGPEVRRLLNSIMSNPSKLLGAGTVISTDLTPPTSPDRDDPGQSQSPSGSRQTTATTTRTSRVVEGLAGMHP